MADAVIANSVTHSQCIIPDTSSNYYSQFKFSIRSEVTRKYYERRIRHFLDFINFEIDDVNIENRCNTFARKANNESRWVIEHTIKFLQFQKTRVENGDITAATLRNYGKSLESFSLEAYDSLNAWMDFREFYGEKITRKSWLMRDLWQTTNMNYGARWGLATNPKRLKSSGIKRLLERAIWERGIRQPLKEGGKRHEWKAAHGFRKYYKTHAEQVMRPINVELTMGHNIGVSASYYKPTEKEVLEDYLKAVDVLTIVGDKTMLQRQVFELKEETKNNEFLIETKLKEKDEIINSMKERYDLDISLLKEAISDMQLLLKNPSRLTEISKSITQEVS